MGRDSSLRTITNFFLQLGRYEPFSPSAKELRELSYCKRSLHKATFYSCINPSPINRLQIRISPIAQGCIIRYSNYMCIDCDTLGSTVASDTRGPGFESSRR